MATKLTNYIGGKFVAPSEGTSFIPVVSPADETVLAEVPLCGEVEVNAAVEVAKKAFIEWSGLTIKQRAGIMLKFHHLMDQHSQELAEIIVKENGKNITEALADVAKGNETVEWAASLPQLAPGRILEVSRGITCQELRAPLGVVAAVVPFNFPAMVPMWTIPISLTMGNCVILKPSEKVPLTMQRIASLLQEAGLPSGVFSIVHGGVQVVNALCDHPDISALTFVGSSKVANLVTERCQQRLGNGKRVLALGGAKNHLIALEDCDIGMAARDIVASFAGCCGQRCMAASVLILVDETAANPSETENSSSRSLDRLLTEITAIASALQPGQGPGQVGPLIDGLALSRVQGYLAEVDQEQQAVQEGKAEKGMKLLLDGRSWSTTPSGKKKGFWCGPTIILHSNPFDRALQEEIFGPVLSVIRVQTREEAIALENGNPYGNAACIYTERGSNAEWFTKRFRAGMLGVNIGIPVPREPFSFGGLYGTNSKYGGYQDITGDGAMEFFSNRLKITSKWSASYGTGAASSSGSSSNGGKGEPVTKKAKVSSSTTVEDKANFDGRM